MRIRLQRQLNELENTYRGPWGVLTIFPWPQYSSGPITTLLVCLTMYENSSFLLFALLHAVNVKCFGGVGGIRTPFFTLDSMGGQRSAQPCECGSRGHTYFGGGNGGGFVSQTHCGCGGTNDHNCL